ncbi:hypothetical protein, conserved [Eimeria praecox]|uniref:Uncharacterized protein n=1 Tax=Eimeria praecox TaxID=51316 RepID=U6G5M3_9EIME|nr:hypothetical protein, conserved [Eimeria praecox]
MFILPERVFGRRLRWLLLFLPLALSLQFVLQIFRVQLSDPHGHSLKRSFIDSGYGFFSYDVDDEICNSPETPELAAAPSAVLQQAHELLLKNKQLSEVLQGKQGQVPVHQLSVHWVFRFAQLSPQQRQTLLQQLQQLEASLSKTNPPFSPTQLQESVELDLSLELATALLLYSKCRHKSSSSTYEERQAGPPRRGAGGEIFEEAPHKEALPKALQPLSQGLSAQGELLRSLGIKTQMFLPTRFLGSADRICHDFAVDLNEQGGRSSPYNTICSPSLETVLQLLPLRLQRWWGRVRWQYHMAEYLRKLLTVFLPLNPYMHTLYRQDMFAFLSVMSPYLELQPPVPIDPSCRPPPAYWVVPLTQQEWNERQQKSKVLQEKQQIMEDTSKQATSKEPSPAEPPASTLQLQKQQQQQRQQQQQPSNVFSIPEEHDNYVLIDDYCRQAKEIHKGFFTGKPRKKPIKIVDAVILGYDLDLLEIRWHELQHSVEYFVVAEAHHHTLGVYQKPLFFSRNKERYSGFLNKVIHLVQPYDASLPVAQRCSEGQLKHDKDACWEYEMFQRDSLLHMLAQINAGTNNYGNTHIPKGFLDDDTLIVISDVDEIVMGKQRTKKLRFVLGGLFNYDSSFHTWRVSFGFVSARVFEVEGLGFGWVLVHYPGRVDAMALKDFKVMSGISQTNYPHAIGPLVDTFPYKSLRHLETKTDFVYERHAYTRHRPSDLSPQLYLHGGWHLSDTSYLPYLYAKVPSDDIKPGYEPWSLYLPLLAQRGIISSPVGGILQAQVAAWRDFRDYRQVPPQYKEIGFGSMPWVMRCNPMRCTAMPCNAPFSFAI